MKFFAAVGVAILLIVAGVAADYWTAMPTQAQASYVGRQTCLECHQDQADKFMGSHHDKAMDLATDETVLGSFDDVTFTHHDVESRFYRDGKKFMVRTEGESGKLEDFEVKYVFGVEPLQQYMVEFDSPPTNAITNTSLSVNSDDSITSDPIPRVQVLRISWDTEKKKWFYLAPPDVEEKLQPDDPLHWTGIAQRWQTMCAECHSTNLRKNFDPQTATYHTTFSEIDVSCESCHGPGSLHIELANSNSLFWDRNHGYGLAQLKGENTTAQLETCAPCHSRRGVMNEAFHAGQRYHDHYQLESLTDATYHADGQIKDEVYVFGSFIQSKMYHKGIRCTDCHDPHSLKLKHPGNETCTSCHQHAAGKYDVPSHHHHAPGTPGAMCVNCHMPHTTYMAVDERRDHSLRVPRPDLSVKLGTPNACSSCHVQDQLETVNAARTNNDIDLSQYANWITAAQQGDVALAEAVAKTDQWCDDACEKWYGQDRRTPSHYAEALAAFRSGEPGGVEKALKLAIGNGDFTTPDIARATAWRELLGAPPQQANVATIAKRAIETATDASQNPLVRAAAIETMRIASPDAIRGPLVDALDDPSALVRNAATRVLIESPAYATLTPNERSRVSLGLDEVNSSLMTADDRAGAHMSWAMLCEQIGRGKSAVEAYQTAIRLEPKRTGARTNLAKLMEQLAANQPAATAKEYQQYATRLRAEELPLLLRDADLVPDSAFLQYQCGLQLYLAGRSDEALKYLTRAVEIEPDVEDFRVALRLLKEKLAEQ